MSTFEGFHATTPHRSAKKRWLKIGAIVVATLVLVTSAAGWFAVTHYSSNIDRVPITHAQGVNLQAATGGAQNILVIGSDTREGLTAAQRKELSTGKSECNCTDTIMLMHLAKDAEGATVVSFPRDLMVDVPAFTDSSGTEHSASTRQINTAYALGGPSLVVQTVEQLTDIHIDHYVQVRFSGVVHVVDAIGGVDVCVKKSFTDKSTHLALSAGTHTLDGIDALKYVRLRHVGDGSDLGRIQRQQQFVVNALAGATSTGVLTNPFKLKNVLDATTSSFVLDDGFSTSDLLSFASRMRAMDRSKLVLLTVPNEAYPPDPNRVQLQQPQADALFAKLQANQPVAKAAAKKASTSTHARTGTSNPCSTPS